MSRVRPEEWERWIIFMPSEARLEIFLKKYKKKGPKIHCLALKLYTGASKSRVKGLFLSKRAKRCIRDSPYLGWRGGAMAPLAPPPWIRYWGMLVLHQFHYLFLLFVTFSALTRSSGEELRQWNFYRQDFHAADNITCICCSCMKAE